MEGTVKLEFGSDWETGIIVISLSLFFLMSLTGPYYKNEAMGAAQLCLTLKFS